MSISDDALMDLSQATPIRETRTELPPLIQIIGAVICAIMMICGFAYYIFVVEKQRPPNAAYNKQHVSPLSESYFRNITPTPIAAKRDVIGFLPYWAVGTKEKVRVERLTQLIYFGLNVNEKGEILKTNAEGKNLNEWNQLNSDYFSDIHKEATLSGVKVSVALKNFEGVRINQLISNPAAVNNLIEESDKLITDKNLDGINIDFEYFSYSDFPTMKYLNDFLGKYTKALRKKHPGIIISFDVNATVVHQDNAYDMVKIGELVDQVILMGYDYHRPNSSIAGPIAPIDGPEEKFTIKRSLASMYGRVPHEKIILAIPFYGNEWQTETAEFGSKTIEKTGATATYERVQKLIDSRKDIDIRWDEQAQSPWIVYKHNGLIKQIHYENDRSMQAKMNLIKEKQLGGTAVWAIGYEGDYEGPWHVIDNFIYNKN